MANDMDPSRVGEDVLGEIFGAMKIDRQWSVRDRRSFRWWGHRLEQTVTADMPYQDHGFSITKVTALESLVNKVPNEAETYIHLAGANNYATMFSLVCRNGTIQSASTAYLHEGNLWYSTLLKAAVAIQAADAERFADTIATAVGGTIAVGRHPATGPRTKPDEMLEVIDRLYVPRGAQQSSFLGAFNKVERLEPNPWVLITADDYGLTAEFDYNNIGHKGLPVHAGGDVVTAMITARADEPHPRFGSGLLVTLNLPVDTGATGETLYFANLLNLAEIVMETNAPLLGSWCFNRRLTYVMFIPSLVGDAFPPDQRSQLIHSLLMGLLQRSDWYRTMSHREGAPAAKR